MILYSVQMLHPNANANQVWRVRAKNKFGARMAVHAEMVRRGMFFMSGEVSRV